MNDDRQDGVCPSCGGRGDAFASCTERVCAQRGYRLVPVDYASLADDGIPDPLIGLDLAEWTIVRLLGRGSFGMVYLGIQAPVGLKAAIKLLSIDDVDRTMRATVLANFEAEGRALAVVQHPNVVRLLQFGSWREHPYLVTDYVDGGITLQHDIELKAGRSEHYGIDEIRSLLGQMLDGLEAAHERGIIHRDIKPNNLMLQKVPGHERLLRILDFGLAKFIDRGDETRLTSGTPEYMAPEQLTRTGLGPWTDLYAVGTLAYELLTGRVPFEAESIERTMFLKLSATYDPVTALVDLELPEKVTTFLGRSIAAEPSERYQSAAGMRVGLRDALDALTTLPDDPLARVSLAPLVEGADISQEPTSLAGPLMMVDTSEGPADSDEAFRRWLDREKEKLGGRS